MVYVESIRHPFIRGSEHCESLSRQAPKKSRTWIVDNLHRSTRRLDSYTYSCILLLDLLVGRKDTSEPVKIIEGLHGTPSAVMFDLT